MEFLADENFPLPSIRLLRNAGFNVKSIGEEKRGIADEHVMEIAVEEGLIILTFDRDYGELIFKYAKKAPPAVVYFRTKGARPDDAGKTLAYRRFVPGRKPNCRTKPPQESIRPYRSRSGGTISL